MQIKWSWCGRSCLISNFGWPFTEVTRSKPGCLWFDWSRSLDDPNEYVLVEAFAGGEAGAAHVQSAHFKQAHRTCRLILRRRRAS